MGVVLHSGEGKGPIRLPLVVVRLLVILQLILAVGTIGYRVIEGWPWLDSMFMAVITVTTIGFGEVQPLSSAGRLFTMAYIVGGLGFATAGVSDLARYFVDGRLLNTVLARRARRELAALRDHVIVIGYGRLGHEIVADLLHHGAVVVVVELLEQAHLPAGVSQIVGDATLDETLIEAGVAHARGVAIATPSDAVNVYITFSVKQLNPSVHISTRVQDEQAAKKARRAGADGVVLPFQLGGTRMAQGLLRPGSSMFVEHATQRDHDDLHMEDVFLSEHTEIEGSLRDLDLRNQYGVIVVALQRATGDGLEYPDAATSVGPGDTLVVVGAPDKVRTFAERAIGSELGGR